MGILNLSWLLRRTSASTNSWLVFFSQKINVNSWGSNPGAKRQCPWLFLQPCLSDAQVSWGQKKTPICNQTIANSILNLLQMQSDQVFLNFTRLCNNPDQFSFPAMDIDDVKRFAKMVDKSWFSSCFTYFFFRWGRTSPLMASCDRALRCMTSTSRSAPGFDEYPLPDPSYFS